MKKIYLIAAVIALVAGFATYFFASELKTSKIVTGVNEATVLVAIDDIDKDTILTKEMFQAVKLPETAVSFGTVSNINDVIGFMAMDNILAGEQLMARKVGPIGREDAMGRLSYQLSNGMYAYTLAVDAINSAGYFIKEGDIINIYNSAVPSAVPALEKIPVLKIGDYAANKQQDAGVEIQTYGLITIGLTKEQVPKFFEVQNSYRIALVSYEEGHDLVDDIANASAPTGQSAEPQTNYGMGEITTSPPVTE